MNLSRIKYLALIGMICLSFILAGCAADKTNSGSAEKIGMHIDAVMEFVVEYPLSWQKDRRLPYGSSSGEVRWTHSDHKDTVLKISSTTAKEAYPGKAFAIKQLVTEYAGLQIATEEKITLPAGEATLLTGQSSKTKINSYLFLTPARSYIMTFASALDETEADKAVITKVTQSFRILSQGKQ